MNSTSEQERIPLLSACEVFKQFGYKEILKGVSLEMQPNQTTLLVGKNGAGKSTLIKILSGLMRPTQGKVLFEDKELSEITDEYRKAFGLITHQTLFYDDLTAEENLLFFGRLKKVKDLKDKTREALEVTGLSQASGFLVKTYSSGMAKRLNIARLMITNPRLLFLDEPYSGLDIDSIKLLNRYLTDFKNNGGSALLISHQIDACYDSSDRVAFLVNGRISREVKCAEFSQAELLEQYQEMN